MLEVKQITPNQILNNKNRLEDYLEEELSSLIKKDSWMTEWKSVAQRFKMLEFKEKSSEEIKEHEWNVEQIEKVIEETIYNVNQYLNFNKIRVTVVPALPFRFFQDQPKSLWTNAFTNGSENIIIAIPPKPNLDFFKYLLAHEAHHATPENPIYNLTMNTFTLEEWCKMEGTAEYFSLSLYPDYRWWKDYFSSDVEKKYWNECKDYLKSTDDHIKSPLCFGSEQLGIPVFSGYSFALRLVSNFVSKNDVKDIRKLFSVDANRFIECYKETVSK
ncbi:DUF2268 domain-containing putative Zn-dependent protease [Alkalibacillus haloalkaliphilus]|uniref:DUF2268 domain-containing putative Zn-dependent protease n=1 Tax=Alkalibacillus haloalkaliphilus TaxID=94136 RepID=UPI0029355BA8|nr:DUF2268 domain-containing putative Zn-dependent protease [Alkalibacillus haloalkaliphilus]MDV2583276.1 DUF2268 domain-containing putative Zn-dependent protease [Alkalibacillus haloalkaliphilus]